MDVSFDKVVWDRLNTGTYLYNAIPKITFDGAKDLLVQWSLPIEVYTKEKGEIWGREHIFDIKTSVARAIEVMPISMILANGALLQPRIFDKALFFTKNNEYLIALSLNHYDNLMSFIINKKGYVDFVEYIVKGYPGTLAGFQLAGYRKTPLFVTPEIQDVFILDMAHLWIVVKQQTMRQENSLITRFILQTDNLELHKKIVGLGVLNGDKSKAV